jgi:ATP-dependent Clp protease ATP-binding subunit ClpB
MKRLLALLAERKIAIDLAPDARSWLADKGYDPVYGARPLKRVIQKYLQDPLAEQILSGQVLDGSEILIEAGSDRLLISPKTAVSAAA